MSVVHLTARVLVAICHNLPVVQTDTCRSLMNLWLGNRASKAKEDYGIAEITCAWYMRHPRVDALRDAALSQAIADGFTHVLFLDADMVFPDDLFLRILKHLDQHAIVSGFYVQRAFPFNPIAMRDGHLHASGLYSQYAYDHAYTEVNEHGLRDEEVVGMGCTLIPMTLVQRLGARPWFEYKNDVDGWPMVSEDVPFCEKIRAAGGRIFVDPSIQCGHLSTFVAEEQHHKRARAVQVATEEQLKGAVTIRVHEPAAEVEA